MRKPSESCCPFALFLMGSMICALWVGADATADRQAAELQAKEYLRPLSEAAMAVKEITQQPQLILAEDPNDISASDAL